MSIQEAIRFSTFNASLNRNSEGQLITDLSTPENQQVKNVAETIQRTNPDVILINEFDYDPNGTTAQLFQQNYLAVSQNGADPVIYPYVYVAPSNTGIASGFDLNNNGSVVTTPGAPGYGDDALGFGNFPGQYGMVLYSKYPIETSDIRTFQNFLWKDMPGALLPDNPATPEPNDWYSPEELEVFRLSSKSHWDIPINVDGNIIHALVSHPTPPTFDGSEDRNGKRNHDEIRFWADYISPGKGDYIYDDTGEQGGLASGESFVIMGDQNADPVDGDSVDNAIRQLLDNPLVNTSETPTSEGGPQQAALQGGANATHQGNPAFDTADFADTAPGNLRVDYVLPSADLDIVNSGVFWPKNDDPLFRLVGVFNPSIPGGFPTSDHRLVRADVTVALPETSVTDVDFIGQATFATGALTVEGTQVGGLSGITYDASKGVYYSISDDRSQINPARFYTLNIDLSDGALSNQDVAFTDATTLLNANNQPFAPLSLDPESIRLTSNGTVFISSEGDVNANPQINPFVNEFSLTGQQIRELPVPQKYLPTTGNSGIRNNLAFESLAITPDQKFLFTATEDALKQDGPNATPSNGSPSRILQYDLRTGQPLKEYLYNTDPVAVTPNTPNASNNNGLVDLLALDNSGTFLSVERSFTAGVGNTIKVYETRLQDATDISNLESLPTDLSGIQPAEKRLVLDLSTLKDPSDPSKPLALDNIEGISFGQPLPDGRQSLILVSDNNFSATQFTQVLAFAIATETSGTVGSDTLVGTSANDNLNGLGGNDTVAGDLGNDLIDGGDGDDVLRGDLNSREPGGSVGGNDTIYGGAGSDRIGGKAGNDELLGDAGDDQIYGDDGDDLLRGGLGNDTLVGDNFSGGNGLDTFVLAAGEGTDTILDFQAGEDFIGLTGGLTFGQLSITQDGQNAAIAFGDQTLAILTGVNTSTLSEVVFTSL